MTAPETPRRRIDLIDALRGLAVVLMVLHHLAFDLVAYAGAPLWLFTNPVFDVLHYIFAGLFIFLSGVSSRFSRSNIKRGLKVLAAALLITPWRTSRHRYAHHLRHLHLLSFCMIFTGSPPAVDAIPRKIAPMLYIASSSARRLPSYR